MLVSVQYARAVAALLVVYAHLRGFGFFTPLDTGEFGGMGVDIFFVISGFIMWESSKGQAPADFALRRLSRIVPAYWAYTTLLILLVLVAPQLTPKIVLDAPSVIWSYLFIPYTDTRGNTNPLLLQGWTLNYEMYFYVVFGLSLFIRHRLIQLGSIVLFFVVSALAGLFVEKDIAIVAYYTSTMLLEFVFGILVNIAAKSRYDGWRLRGGAFLLGIALLLGIGIGDPTAEPRFIMFGLPAAIMLFGLVGLETAVRRRPIKPLALIGDSSYSLYLSHPFVLSGVSAVFKLIDARLFPIAGVAGAGLFGAACVLASVVFAYLSFRFFEKPAGKYLNGLFRGPRSQVPRPALTWPFRSQEKR
ncbi:MAG: acyltransferase [Rhizobium sp.]|nr:acyltransferase [Rhizobium sp.]